VTSSAVRARRAGDVEIEDSASENDLVEVRIGGEEAWSAAKHCEVSF
jgi:hypothetical protein